MDSGSGNGVDLSIVVVSWNVRDDLAECLGSIRSSIEPGSLRVEVIVVDNASSDGSAEMVRTRFPQVRLVQNDTNEGFSRANNRAFPLCTGRYVLLLNPDAVLVPGTLDRCVDYLREHPDVGMLGCKLVHPDGAAQHESARRFPTLLGVFFESMYLDLLFPRSSLFNRALVPGFDWESSGAVPAVTGAFLMARRETVDRVGPMDDTVPMYLDDIDWCYRSWQARLPVHYAGSASVVHKRARSSAGLDRTRHWIRLTCDAKTEFFRKHRGLGSALACRAILLWGGLVRFLVSLLLWPFRPALKRFPRVHRTIDPRVHLAQMAWALDLASLNRWAGRPVTGDPEPPATGPPSDSRVARNTVLNLVGRAAPLVAGVVTIPFLVRTLGRDRFALVALAWVLVGYLGLFDLGLGPSVSRFVAREMTLGTTRRIPSIAWSAMAVQGALGVVGAGILAALTPVLVNHVLDVPGHLAAEARLTFYLLAISIPVLLVSGSVRGLLEGAQRFDLVNAVAVPASISIFVLPLIAAELGSGLVAIAALLLVSRAAALIGFAGLAGRLFPSLWRPPSARFSRPLLRDLLRFGGWVTASSVILPINVYADRVLIGALLPLGALAVYTPAVEVVTRLEVVPTSLVAALFPALSALGIDRTADVERMFGRAMRYLFLLTAPLLIFLFVFAPELLRVWLGAGIAGPATPVFRILLVGELVGILAPVAGTVLWARGRPDLTAKAYMAYFVPNLLLLWILLEAIGLKGAATVFAVFSVADAVLLTVLALRVTGTPPGRFFRDLAVAPTVGVLAVFGGVLALVHIAPLPVQIIGTIAAAGLLLVVVWGALLGDVDRDIIRSSLHALRPRRTPHRV